MSIRELEADVAARQSAGCMQEAADGRDDPHSLVRFGASDQTPSAGVFDCRKGYLYPGILPDAGSLLAPIQLVPVNTNAVSRQLALLAPAAVESHRIAVAGIDRGPVSAALGFVVLLTTAEVITSFADPVAGVVVHVILLMLTMIYSAREDNARLRAVALSLMLLPLIRLVSLGLPLHTFSLPWRFILTGVPLLAASYTVMRSLNLSAREVGLRLPTLRYVLPTLVVALSGIPIGYVEYQVLRPEGVIDVSSPAAWIFPSLAILIGTAFMEELLFRGILQTTLLRVFKVLPSIMLASVLFSVMHIGYLSFVDVGIVFLAGLYFAWVVWMTRSLIGVILAHAITNIMLFIILPNSLV